MENKPYNVVSFSGGKDSTAMLLRMVELDMPIDEIIFADTSVEFPEMYEHIDKVEKYINKPITRLTAPHSFEWYLLEADSAKNKSSQGYKGKSFPSMRIRWCSNIYKRDIIRQHFHGKKYEEYVGIAYDEPQRVRDKHYPLVEWKWTERECLEYCYSKGFDWGGLYNYFDRLSCWCCPLKRVDEYRTLRKIHPELWNKLLEWQKNTWRDFTKEANALKLEVRFAYEDEIGETPRTKAFFQEVNRRYEALS